MEKDYYKDYDKRVSWDLTSIFKDDEELNKKIDELNTSINKITIPDLKDFCKAALQKEGMKNEYAAIVAEVLSETDAFGIHSHGTKNLPGYIQKIRAGGIDIHAEPEIVSDAAALATLDAKRAIGMVPSVQAMELACQKAANTGLAIITVRNSCHFGAAGYYANIAAKCGMVGIAMSNVDPNMTIPGAKGMVVGNNPKYHCCTLPRRK